MTIQSIIATLESVAPSALQEDYDNAGLITGSPEWNCTGVLLTLDATEEVILEAIQHHCNLVIAHHPIVFKGLKKINGKHYSERAVIAAIKNDVAILAVHTNLDNILTGVNGWAANLLGLKNIEILAPKKQLIAKLQVYVPSAYRQKLETALFEAGAGHLGNYSECGFYSEGWGSFKAINEAQPFLGEIGQRHTELEHKLEVLFPLWLKHKVLKAMRLAHPYEEVAYEVQVLENEWGEVGAGIVGEWPDAMEEDEALSKIKQVFGLQLIRHTPFLGKKVKKIAFCGGAGSFLTTTAIAKGADLFITADVKYHEFFEADGKLILADIGHFESERHTIDLLADVLRQKFPTFALLKSEVNTNPVKNFI
jgi:dinuclear metal center YbgI/SA1388 family protein